MRKLSLVGVVVVCLAGCGAGSSTPPLPPHPSEPRPSGNSEPGKPRHQPADRTRLLAQLEAAHAHWASHGPPKYELTVSLECCCDPGVPFRSRVNGLRDWRQAFDDERAWIAEVEVLR